MQDCRQRGWWRKNERKWCRDGIRSSVGCLDIFVRSRVLDVWMKGRGVDKDMGGLLDKGVGVEMKEWQVLGVKREEGVKIERGEGERIGGRREGMKK